MPTSGVYKTRFLERFAIWKLESHPGGKLVILDLYPMYQNFCNDTGAPIGTIAEMVDAIKKHHVNAVIKDGVIRDLRFKDNRFEVPPDPKPAPLSQQQRLMLLRFDHFIYDYSRVGHGAPFDATTFANYETTSLVNGSYEPGYAKIDPVYAADWLRSHPHVFEKNGKFYYRPG